MEKIEGQKYVNFCEFWLPFRQVSAVYFAVVWRPCLSEEPVEPRPYINQAWAMQEKYSMHFSHKGNSK